MKKITLALLFLLFISPAFAQDCGGKERWAVKVLADEDASKINMAPEPAIIEEMINLNTTDVGTNTPRQDIELKTYEVLAKIKEYKTETDADIHIVLVDPKDSTKTMIGEIPDPDCRIAKGSGHAKEYTQARGILSKYTLPDSSESGKAWQHVEEGFYKVIGVGFIDFPHGQTGKAPNNMELHPILSIEKCKNAECKE